MIDTQTIDWIGAPQPALPIEAPRARRTDPETSHEAAQAVLGSGQVKVQQAIVLEAVLRWPGLTSLELAARLRLDRYQVARRLPELERAGLVAKGPARRVGLRYGVTWLPAPGV
jgi:DNA-binding MarR family transcriptional regulator